MNNNREYNSLLPGCSPHERHQLTDLTIKTNVTQTKRLAQMFVEFGGLKSQRLYWSDTKCMIDSDLVDKDSRAVDEYSCALASLPSSVWQRPTFPVF